MKTVLFSGRVQGWNFCTETLNALRPFHGCLSLNTTQPTPSDQAFCMEYGIKSIRFDTPPPLPEAIAARARYNMDETRKQNTWAMFYHRARVFDLVPSDTECVVSFRADIVEETPLPLDPVEPGVLYVPEGEDHNGLNDQIAYGSYETMRVYSELFDAIPTLVLQDGVEFHPETLLAAHVQRQGLRVHRFPYRWSLHWARH